MDEETFWIVIVIAAVFLVVIIALIVELSGPRLVIIDDNGGNGGQTLPRIFQPCPNNLCATPNLVCTRPAGQNEAICLLGPDQPCFVDQECSSGFCRRDNPNEIGSCQAQGPGPGPGPVPPPGQTQIYCHGVDNTTTWQQRYTIPNGITLNRIASTISPSSNTEVLLGISPSQNAAYERMGNTWTQIRASINPPGSLLDGDQVGSNIWLVYNIPASGQTLIYLVNQNSLVPFPQSTGGQQRTSNGQTITIEELVVHPVGDIFLVGRVGSGQETIYRQRNGENSYQAISPGQKVALVPDKSPDNFAFVSGSSILIVGDRPGRIDNLPGQVIDMVVTPNYNLWYIVNGQLYFNQTLILPPVTITSSSRLFYSSVNGVCLFTPGR